MLLQTHQKHFSQSRLHMDSYALQRLQPARKFFHDLQGCIRIINIVIGKLFAMKLFRIAIENPNQVASDKKLLFDVDFLRSEEIVLIHM